MAPATNRPFMKSEPGSYEVFFMKDEIDHLIKKVLEAGGEVELVDNILPADYEQIALIEE